MNDFLESSVENIIYENREKIHERGFCEFHTNTIRQLVLPSGKKIDLFTYEIIDKVLYLKIIELKRDKVTEESVWQIGGYFYEILELTAGLFSSVKMKLVIVGSALCPYAAMLADLKSEIDFYIYKYGYDGIEFTKIKSGIDSYNEIESTPSHSAVDFVKKLKEPYGTIVSMEDTSKIYE